MFRRIRKGAGLLAAVVGAAAVGTLGVATYKTIGLGDRSAKALKPCPADYTQLLPIAACFAEGTPPDVMAAVNQAMYKQWLESNRKSAGEAGAEYFTGTRWSGTTGTPRVVTWSFAPDGLSIPSGIGEGTKPNTLFATMDSKFGGNRALWIAQFQSIFDRWAALSGLSYQRIKFNGNDWDDGASWGSGGNANRGEVRISMKVIDGVNGVLAYNSFPPGGDMVLDSSESWQNSSNSYRFLRNVLGHEHGHGMGVFHVCPTSQTKLMEPFVSTAYDGPRHDDVRASQRLYGDAFEENDNTNQATDLGGLASGVPMAFGTVPPPSIPNGSTISIDGTNDADYYKFNVTSAGNLDISINPIGLNYDSSQQLQNGNCSSGNFVNSLTIGDLQFSILDGNGNVMVSSNSQPAGVSEVLNDFFLPAAGTYYLFVSVSGSISQSQLYNGSLNFDTSGAPPVIVTQPKSARVAVGKSVSFTVVAQGPGTITYQWKKDGLDIPGATQPTLTIDPVQTTDAGNYEVLVKNEFGQVLSDRAKLSVLRPGGPAG